MGVEGSFWRRKKLALIEEPYYQVYKEEQTHKNSSRMNEFSKKYEWKYGSKKKFGRTILLTLVNVRVTRKYGILRKIYNL